jgi:uncharacterized glyoxalase superfamily protein PhnB
MNLLPFLTALISTSSLASVNNDKNPVYNTTIEYTLSDYAAMRHYSLADSTFKDSLKNIEKILKAKDCSNIKFFEDRTWELGGMLDDDNILSGKITGLAICPSPSRLQGNVIQSFTVFTSDSHRLEFQIKNEDQYEEINFYADQLKSSKEIETEEILNSAEIKRNAEDILSTSSWDSLSKLALKINFRLNSTGNFMRWVTFTSEESVKNVTVALKKEGCNLIQIKPKQYWGEGFVGYTFPATAKCSRSLEVTVSVASRYTPMGTNHYKIEIQDSRTNESNNYVFFGKTLQEN